MITDVLQISWAFTGYLYFGSSIIAFTVCTGVYIVSVTVGNDM